MAGVIVTMVEFLTYTLRQSHIQILVEQIEQFVPKDAPMNVSDLMLRDTNLLQSDPGKIRAVQIKEANNSDSWTGNLKFNISLHHFVWSIQMR